VSSIYRNAAAIITRIVLVTIRSFKVGLEYLIEYRLRHHHKTHYVAGVSISDGKILQYADRVSPLRNITTALLLSHQ
jgi:hypothetical protein